MMLVRRQRGPPAALQEGGQTTAVCMSGCDGATASPASRRASPHTPTTRLHKHSRMRRAEGIGWDGVDWDGMVQHWQEGRERFPAQPQATACQSYPERKVAQRHSSAPARLLLNSLPFEITMSSSPGRTCLWRGDPAR